MGHQDTAMLKMTSYYSIQFCICNSNYYCFFHLHSFDDDNLPIVIDDLDCSTYSGIQYLTIFQCSYSTTIRSSCTSNKDVSVTCCECIFAIGCISVCMNINTMPE